MIILKNAQFIDYKTLDFKTSNIVVEEGVEGKIKFVDQLEETRLAENRVIDCSGKLVTKSFACGHHHAYSGLARGMPAPKKPITNFFETLQYIWWVLDMCLDKETIKASAYATAIACAKAGVTFAIDHHSSPEFLKGSLDILAKTFDEVGVSHLLCYEITDRNGLNKTQEALEESEEYVKNNQGLIGLHASFTVGDKTLKKAVEIAQKYNSGIHIHVAEDKADQNHCQHNYNQRVINRLYKAGVLDLPKSILVHCLHIDSDERDIFKNTKAWIAQNTDSNLNNNVGYFNSKWLRNRIMLGTDGMHSDMLQSARAAFLIGQGFDEIGFDTAYNRFRKAHEYLESNNFKGDGDNNLVVLDYDSPTEVNKDNFLGHFVYGLGAKHVQHVISNGKLIVEDRKITTINEQEITKFTREQSVRLWEKMKKFKLK